LSYATDCEECHDLAESGLKKVERAVFRAADELPAYQSALIVKQASRGLRYATTDSSVAADKQQQLERKLAALEEKARPELEERCSGFESSQYVAAAFFCYAQFASTFPDDTNASDKRDALKSQAQAQVTMDYAIRGPRAAAAAFGSGLPSHIRLSRDDDSQRLVVTIDSNDPIITPESYTEEQQKSYVTGTKTEPNSKYEDLERSIAKLEKSIADRYASLERLQKSPSHQAAQVEHARNGIEREEDLLA